MSIINPTSHPNPLDIESQAAGGRHNLQETLRDSATLQRVLESVQAKIAPVWPLKDYVAVNPYLGFSDQTFLDARQSLQAVSDCETLMPVSYYRDQYRRGQILKADLDAAVDELVSDRVPGAEAIDVNQLLALLKEPSGGETEQASSKVGPEHQGYKIRLISECLDTNHGSDWCGAILGEISKHCSAHYDDGQSIWPSPWKHLPLYQAWRCAMQHDRSLEVLGVAGFRSLVNLLPHQPHAAVKWLLVRLGMPAKLWEPWLHCIAMSMVGWSAWANYQQRRAVDGLEENNDFVGLLAMRLAYEVAMSEHFAFTVDWNSVVRGLNSSAAGDASYKHHDLLHYGLLKASEVAYRRSLLARMVEPEDSGESCSNVTASTGQAGEVESAGGTLAQMVFCIDVRSERIRRHLEASAAEIETFGFAGFFGLPIGWLPLGESECVDQVPALLSPQFIVRESVQGLGEQESDLAMEKRSIVRGLRRSWKEFQSSAASSFGFVETTGVLYGLKLMARSLGWSQESRGRFDGVADHSCKHLGPDLHGLEEQGITLQKQADLAESMLRGIGLTDHFARLVVFCGHGSQTENNPLQAGLDCGACGGHSGEANARFAAKLLNQKSVREALSQRGIKIGNEVHFVGALHNTTTDELTFFDTSAIPESHQAELNRLGQQAEIASQATRAERLGVLPGRTSQDLFRRSRDWSEVRPEWGLAGNAAFIAAPRQWTESASLDGRSFLHSYDYRRDPEFRILEQIMTAPMVVANWINMQYYASTVDPTHFGSGSKTIHNVVGRFGVLSGNGGDLMTGLPWQSIHDGQDFQHHPLRLLVILAAPREAIDRIIAKHSNVKDLVTNGWIQLVALEADKFYRFTEGQAWDRLQITSNTTEDSETTAALLATS